MISPIIVIVNDIPNTVKIVRNIIRAAKPSVGEINLDDKNSAKRPIATGSIIITITQIIGNVINMLIATSLLNPPAERIILIDPINNTDSVQIIAPNNAPSLPFFG